MYLVFTRMLGESYRRRLRSLLLLAECCFKSTETVCRLIRDREPRTATSTFTQL